MTAISLRKAARQYASHLNREQRRKWFVQRLTLTPRVNVSGSYVPPCVARQFQHIQSIRGGA